MADHSPAHGEVHHGTHDAHAHPTPKLYIQLAVLLTVITLIEVFLLYLPDMGVPVGGSLLVIIFGLLSVLKFLVVVGWYMHLKFDPVFFRGVFAFALVVALTVATAFIALFHGMYPF